MLEALRAELSTDLPRSSSDSGGLGDVSEMSVVRASRSIPWPGSKRGEAEALQQAFRSVEVSPGHAARTIIETRP